MNFFKALLNINSLREENEQLHQDKLDLASHNLQMQGQLESMRNLVYDQGNTVNRLKSEYDKVYAELSKLKSFARNQKPVSKNNATPPPSMAAPAPKQNKAKGFAAASNSNTAQPRRGRKPKATNQ